MKVWILTETPLGESNGFIVGVFADKRSAEKERERLNRIEWENRTIEEWEVKP